ncbi:MAG: hypothetical protein LJU34_09430, partial [Oscillospiraceae bacterium]|nr:hypothetical protein [Oscillospiraceae bacterium]
ILAHGGIYLVVPYIYFSYKWIRTSIRKRDMNRFLFFACFAILFTITVTSYRFLTLFIFMAYDFGINRETERVSKKENSINPISNEMRLEGQT